MNITFSSFKKRKGQVTRMKEKVLLIGGNSLVGRLMATSLEDDYQIVLTAGHHNPEGGYCLTVEDPDKLMEILIREDPHIIISSVRGNFTAQMNFHKVLAEWIAGKPKRLLYISTANVFDGNFSRPWTEEDIPTPKSEYGIFKRDCELMLSRILGRQLIVFRLSFVWSSKCPRVQKLNLDSHNGEQHCTYANYMINVTFGNQIGSYAKYVLSHNLSGVFHVGTTDLVNYFSFEKMICKVLNMQQPDFVTEIAARKKVAAVLPSRKEIPDVLQMTVLDGLETLKNSKSI